MIILENVEKNDNVIIGDYYMPPDKALDDWGHFEFDIEKNDYSKIIYCKLHREGDVKYGLGHMTKLIRQMIEYNNYPKHSSISWY